MKTAVLGATGLVGRTMLRLLADCPWADQPPLLLASSRSAGRQLDFRGEPATCIDAADADFAGVRIALFSAGAKASLEYGPKAAAAGAVVIDNSSAFRRDADVPLVVPEANADHLPAGGGGAIIANPNCSTIQIAVALAPLERAFGLRAAHCTTLQAVSGAGQSGVAELAAQVRDEGADREASMAAGDFEVDGADAGDLFPRRIAFNAIPSIGPALDDGSFQEEEKVGFELRKILSRPDLAVTCTAVRVPVWNGHSVAVRAVLRRGVSVTDAAEALGAVEGLRLLDGPHAYATPAEISGGGDTVVGRLRGEPGRDDVLLFWVVADNLLKGAALNAVQIADSVIRRGGSE